MSYPAENIGRIESEITELVADLYEAFSAGSDNETQSDSVALDRYIKRVARIGLCAGKEGLVSLQDICVVYRQILGHLRESGKLLSDHMRERLEVWPMLAMGLLSGSVDDDLYAAVVEFFEDPVWPQTLSNEDVAFLRSQIKPTALLITDKESVIDDEADYTDENAVDGVYPEAYLTIPYDNLTLEALQQEILETIADLLIDLADNTDGQVAAEYADSFNLCADRTELVGITVATMGFMGLMDVCQYFQYSLREIAKSEEPVSEQIQVVLEEWPSRVIAYLSSPDDTEITDALVEYIKNIPWTAELLDEEAVTLRELLLQESTENNHEQELLEPEGFTKTHQDNGHDVGQGCDYELNDQPHDVCVEKESENIETSDIESVAFCEQINELVEIVKLEIEANTADLNAYVQLIFSVNAETNEIAEAVKNYLSLVERFRLAAESIGMTALSRILKNISDNIAYWNAHETEITEEQLAFIADWPQMVTRYLADIASEEPCAKLAEAINKARMPVDICYDSIELSNELNNPVFPSDEDDERRPTDAHADDVSLTLPEDVNQQLLDTLLHELPGQTAQFTAAISRLVEGNATLQVVEVAQRIAHTLKGSANTVGVKGIATLTHHIEDILTAFVKHTRLPGAALSDVLMNAADVLEAMSEALLGVGSAPANARSVLQDILNWANRIDQFGIAEIDANTIEHSPSEDNTSEEAIANGSKPDDASMQTMLRVPAELLDELLRLVGESLILSGQLHERVYQLSEQARLEQEQNKLFQQLCFELEQITDIKGMVTREKNGTYDDVFDSLELDQYNELHTITHRLVEAATDAKELTHGIEDGLNSLDELLIDQARLQKETQEVVMRTRMVTVQNIVPRLQRIVRQTCRFTGKQAILDVTGADTMIDSDVLDDLIDPLMHVIRNAIDHGIEVPELRIEKGKEPRGRIMLKFSRNGDHINVQCSDDGTGLDYQAIKAQAIDKGLTSIDSDLSEEELTRLVWLPGFTTKEQTTQISGRGIGMDAVYSQIMALKGSLNIVSSADTGTTVEMQLPLTLISIHALLVSAYNQHLAISSRGIEQILPPGDGFVDSHNAKPTFHIGDDYYEITDLESMLHLPFNRENQDRTVLLVRGETGENHAIALDKVLASRDVVVKQLGPFMPKIEGIEGATILGDGSIAPVIDLPSLLRNRNSESISPWLEQLEETGVRTDAPYALIVDDSLSARRSLAEYVKDLGYEILTAKDGLEAIEVIESKCPDIMLVDFEMPRMNGVELTTHVRADERTRHMPIIMITSRATEKHQAMATSAGVNVYLTKPFSEDKLMEHIHDLYQQPRRSA